VKKEIVNVFDHALVVSRKFDKKKMEMFTKMVGNTIVVEYQPTCENLVADFAERIAGYLPQDVKLHNLRLYETATSFAEWYASDNQ
jgi:6-pyruvoyltetrahydropterin/6-carboxytetrahydropterin synthase